MRRPITTLTNGGHISYIELDGDPAQNLEAFETVVRCMKEAGIGYGSINHPVDRDPVCGYTGIINDVCPQCGRSAEEHDGHPNFERIRRITGYLVGTLDHFNNAKARRGKRPCDPLSRHWKRRDGAGLNFVTPWADPLSLWRENIDVLGTRTPKPGPPTKSRDEKARMGILPAFLCGSAERRAFCTFRPM